MKDSRGAIVHWALFKAQQKRENPHASFYTEGSQRLSCLNRPLASCLFADCSAFVADLYSWAGAPSPTKGENPWTGSLIAHGKQVTLEELRIGDVVIYFNGPEFNPSTGSHTSVVVSLGPDPLTVSFGQQSEPALVRVSQDGRAHKFFTYDTITKKVIYPPGTKKRKL